MFASYCVLQVLVVIAHPQMQHYRRNRCDSSKLNSHFLIATNRSVSFNIEIFKHNRLVLIKRTRCREIIEHELCARNSKCMQNELVLFEEVVVADDEERCKYLVWTRSLAFYFCFYEVKYTFPISMERDYVYYTWRYMHVNTQDIIFHLDFSLTHAAAIFVSVGRISFRIQCMVGVCKRQTLSNIYSMPSSHAKTRDYRQIYTHTHMHTQCWLLCKNQSHY